MVSLLLHYLVVVESSQRYDKRLVIVGYYLGIRLRTVILNQNG